MPYIYGNWNECPQFLPKGRNAHKWLLPCLLLVLLNLLEAKCQWLGEYDILCWKNLFQSGPLYELHGELCQIHLSNCLLKLYLDLHLRVSYGRIDSWHLLNKLHERNRRKNKSSPFSQICQLLYNRCRSMDCICIKMAPSQPADFCR